MKEIFRNETRNMPRDEKISFIVITDDDLVSRTFDYVIRIPDDISRNGIVTTSLLQNMHFYVGK